MRWIFISGASHRAALDSKYHNVVNLYGALSFPNTTYINTPESRYANSELTTNPNAVLLEYAYCGYFCRDIIHCRTWSSFRREILVPATCDGITE